jgi:hypothetical protein
MEAVRKINDAYERHLASGSTDRPKWPANLRIKPVQAANGVWEVTWSFTGPDGRATFEYADMDGELGIRWRRIGGHEILKSP